MSQVIQIPVEKRVLQGKGAIRRLRRQQKIPFILYGAGKSPEMLAISENVLKKSLENPAFFSSIIRLECEGETQQAVLKALQRHSFKPTVQHMDFLRINEKEAIVMHVPLQIIGEDKASGIKLGGGILEKNMTDVEIKCLPKDLPEFIEVDVSQLQLGHSIHLSDLKLPAGVSLTIAELDSQHDAAIVSIHAPSVHVEEESVAHPAAEEAPSAETKSADEKK